MKTFDTNFAIEAAKKTGASPVWILKIPFVAGTIYLSDRTFTYTGITIKPWITNWGAIDETIIDEMGLPLVSEFSANIIIDPDEATDIHDLLWSESVETLKCELYLWFEGLTVGTDPMELMWAGNIVDFERTNELAYNVRLADESVRLDKYPGRVLSLADYADASLNDVGYQMPIIYGDVSKSQALRLSVGKITTLIDEIDGVETDFYLTDGTGFANGTSIIIGTEEISITTISGNHITVCVRAQNSTTAEVHFQGALVMEKQATCVFMFADHPVKAIDNVYALRPADGIPVDITSLCTLYTGQTGDELAGYEDKAVITTPGYITFQQAVDIGLVDTMGVSTTTTATVVEERWCADADLPSSGGPHAYTTDTFTYTDMPAGDTLEKWIEVYWTISGIDEGPYHTMTLDVSPGGAGWAVGDTITGQTSNTQCKIVCVTSNKIYIVNGLTGSFTLGEILTNGTATADQGVNYPTTVAYSESVQYTKFYRDSDSATSTSLVSTDSVGKVNTLTSSPVVIVLDNEEDWPTSCKITYPTSTPYDPDYTVVVSAVKQCQRITPALSSSRTGALSISGTQTADIIIGDRLLVDGEGYQDDGSGTFTGTPSALIEQPDHIFKHFLYTYVAWPTADFSTDAATSFAADGYVFSMAITERKRMKEWLAYMALQCRSWFRFANGKAYLLYRPDSLSSDKTITASMIRMNDDYTTSMHGPSRSPLTEIINKIALHYSRDWTLPAGATAYKAVVTVQDATSITAYGEKERPDTFLFDFVSDATMAGDLAAFYLARYKDRKKVVSMDLFLDNAALEFADVITVTPLSDLVGEVRKVNFTPGSGRDMRNDMIQITMREY